jgi:hypothetical protein
MISAPALKLVTCVVDAGTPQTLGEPEPPQVLAPLQLPQFSTLPQPSLMLPQFLPAEAHVMGEQATHWLLTQLCPVPQGPQSMASPQPSKAVPQPYPWPAQVFGTQQVLVVVQTCPATEQAPALPQEAMVPPQPSGMLVPQP